MTTLQPASRVPVVGLSVEAVSMTQMVEIVLDWTESSQLHTAVGVNAAVCNLAATDTRFRSLVERADLRYADGQSIVWSANALGGHLPERVATTDLVGPLMSACAAAGKRVFLYGGRPDVVAAAARRLQDAAPGLRIAYRDGYGPADQVDDLLDEIHDFATDVLLVGLGDPLQQEWIEAVRDRLRVPAVLTCGGLFDWASGYRKRAPRWMIGAGLEWLWRLLLEPRRLAARYLLGNPAFLARFAVQYMRSRSRVQPL